jgi:hypothetical protein
MAESRPGEDQSARARRLVDLLPGQEHGFVESDEEVLVGLLVIDDVLVNAGVGRDRNASRVWQNSRCDD